MTKTAFACLLALAASLGSVHPTLAATCYGHTPCKACKNCKYCKHCAKGGGTCGVCKPAKARQGKGFDGLFPKTSQKSDPYAAFRTAAPKPEKSPALQVWEFVSQYKNLLQETRAVWTATRPVCVAALSGGYGHQVAQSEHVKRAHHLQRRLLGFSVRVRMFSFAQQEKALNLGENWKYEELLRLLAAACHAMDSMLTACNDYVAGESKGAYGQAGEGYLAIVNQFDAEINAWRPEPGT